MSAGLQCNGFPAFDAYGACSQHSVQFFDTRMPEKAVISSSELRLKQGSCSSREPLRLAFSGRLDPIKGVEDLVPVIAEARRAGADVTLDIFGDGPSRALIEHQIGAGGLDDAITLHGSVDYLTRLVPFFRQNVDMFLCCHKQADPSCTYMETAGCGVPTIGYNNAALRGLLSLGGFGDVCRMGDIKQLANIVVDLCENRQKVTEMMSVAASVARSHSFEREFAKRVVHLSEASETAAHVASLPRVPVFPTRLDLRNAA
ncbi:glycosyltransferase involved in cell wall biosynthesis [Sphingomonas jejuensis]|uniref:Glycosyltransferase involved in cell wall biosynthesis n=1 Tax=Sphingomonas jejuensis TaxID=904715 RepID=A0ABX0XLM3_9SPHN|nr:glycosyltransferase [Sphingomonas jejuensis]NJC34272.1 glycosyltransferase involved in cell wall biosynthesis [Sphingomonas jejuensis]